MSVTFKKKITKKPKSTPRKRKKVYKTQDKIDTDAKKQVEQLAEAFDKFHSSPDYELHQMIQPLPENAGKKSHRLNSEQQEARLVLLHRMLIRKVAPKEIREIMGLSEPLFYQLKDRLKKRMRLDVTKVDVPYLIGDTMAFYDEVRSMALTMSSSTAIKDHRVKVSAMQVALKAELDKNTFLQQCGVYSAPIVEHVVRGMISGGNFTTIDGETSKVIEAEEVNRELAQRLKEIALSRAVNCTDTVDQQVGLSEFEPVDESEEP